MSRYVVYINDSGVVKMWDNENPNENNAPFCLQDVHPDGRPWTDKAESEKWVTDNHDVSLMTFVTQEPLV